MLLGFKDAFSSPFFLKKNYYLSSCRGRCWSFLLRFVSPLPPFLARFKVAVPLHSLLVVIFTSFVHIFYFKIARLCRYTALDSFIPSLFATEWHVAQDDQMQKMFVVLLYRILGDCLAAANFLTRRRRRRKKSQQCCCWFLSPFTPFFRIDIMLSNGDVFL
eukprot:TRINITY_DN2200_c3_g1_i1.p1 TRINITY_DN2200_c3_g1~~TRINITY_DN2200_c3_g1_i1.p1  ORF type:complete len:161 (+),score=7.57 TRINITY_DN2200_c3_g1_i1:527-1009(+)